MPANRTACLELPAAEAEGRERPSQPLRLVPGPDGRARANPGPALFSPLELLVIGVGERDRQPLFKPGGRLARLRRLLFGIEDPTPFRDPRLESLRSLAGALRRRRRSPHAEVTAALANGVTPQQLIYLKARG